MSCRRITSLPIIQKKSKIHKKTRLQRLKVGETKGKKNNEERKQQTQSKKKVDFLYEVGFLGETGKKGPFFGL